MHKVLHGDRATAQRDRHRPARPARRRDRRRARARQSRSRRPPARGARRLVRRRRESAHQPGPADSARRSRQRASRDRSSSSRSSSSRRAHREAIARVKEVLGSATDPGIEIEIALRKHALPFEFSEAAASGRRKRLPTDVRPADRKGRIDLTHLPLVTIDGETAKDFDDAVYCERKGKGFRLIVAIADVVALRPRRRRARRRRARARHVRVLPAARDPDAARGAVERAVLAQARRRPAVHGLRHAASIARRARSTSYAFYPAVMHSRARLTYTQVWQWLTEPGAARRRAGDARCCRISRNLYALYKALFAAREQRGAIDFDTVELALEFDEHGKIARIVPAPRNDAHKLIEECMLAANVCAADFLAKHEQPALYRDPREAAAGQARRAARVPRRLRADAGRRRRADGDGLREAARPHPRPARFRAAADGAAALAVAGAVQPGQRRPLRPRVRRVRAFHVADPPLSRPARASRDQGGAGRQALHAVRTVVGGSSACTAR